MWIIPSPSVFVSDKIEKCGGGNPQRLRRAIPSRSCHMPRESDQLCYIIHFLSNLILPLRQSCNEREDSVIIDRLPFFWISKMKVAQYQKSVSSQSQSQSINEEGKRRQRAKVCNLATPLPARFPRVNTLISHGKLAKLFPFHELFRTL